MPTLPTLTIADQVVWDRVFAAFNGLPAEYKSWLREAVRAEVERREMVVLQANAAAQMRTRQTELSGLLDGAT